MTTRDEVLSRVERGFAAFTASIAGIPTERMNEPGSCGPWTVQQSIGHVAFWDRWIVDKFTRRTVGGEAETQDWRRLNDESADAAARLPLDDVIAELHANYADLLRAIRALPADADAAELDLSDHYDEHGARIRAWRRASGIDQVRSKEDLVRAIGDSWSELNRTFAGLPAERLAEPGACGDWSVKDLLGHIAFWERQAIAEARRRESGEPGREIDVQALNEQDAAANVHRSFQDLHAEFVAAHAELLTALKSLKKPDLDALKDDTWAHYDEHADQIGAWRVSIGQ